MWFLYVFTQWSELMQKHVNISLEWAGSDSRIVVVIPRPPTNTESYTEGSEFYAIIAGKSRKATYLSILCLNTLFLSPESKIGAHIELINCLKKL